MAIFLKLTLNYLWNMHGYPNPNPNLFLDTNSTY